MLLSFFTLTCAFAGSVLNRTSVVSSKQLICKIQEVIFALDVWSGRYIKESIRCFHQEFNSDLKDDINIFSQLHTCLIFHADFSNFIHTLNSPTRKLYILILFIT